MTIVRENNNKVKTKKSEKKLRKKFVSENRTKK